MSSRSVARNGDVAVGPLCLIRDVNESTPPEKQSPMPRGSLGCADGAVGASMVTGASSGYQACHTPISARQFSSRKGSTGIERRSGSRNDTARGSSATSQGLPEVEAWPENDEGRSNQSCSTCPSPA